jgi:hypothetical protein
VKPACCCDVREQRRFVLGFSQQGFLGERLAAMDKDGAPQGVSLLAKRRQANRKWLTVSGSRQVWHSPESTAPNRARYALRPTWPVRICVMMVH